MACITCITKCQEKLFKKTYYDFLEDIRVSFRDTFCEGDYNSLQWKTFGDYLKSKRSILISLSGDYYWKENSGEFCTILLDELQAFGCDNKILLNVMIDLITIFNMDTSRMPHDNQRSEEALRNHLVNSAMTNFEYNSDISSLSDYEGIKMFTAFNPHCLSRFNFRKQKQFMEILAKYGQIKGLPEVSYFLLSMITDIITDFVTQFHGDPRDMDDMYGAIDEMFSIVFAIQEKTLEESFYNSKSPQSMKRIFLTAVGIQAIFQKLEDDFTSDNQISLLNLYFAAVPEPFITLNEVKSLLHVWFSHLNKSDLEDQYYEMYKNLMPESTECFQPRKLTELSRIQARLYLGRYDLLPLAIDKVKLPEKLKDFIRL